MRTRLAALATLLALLIAAPAQERPASAEVWWSLAPLARPVTPAIKEAKLAGWPRNPIDQFILARLHQKALEPSPPADSRTLLRRVTFDLTGLPPTPEEMKVFLADNAPDAYEKVVDRLLASPRHGERWARHWMDAVHFAETHGHDQDRPRPNAWPYRDYLIRSFNDDKPYPRFVKEQIAGDVLYPDDPQAITALGMLGSGPWDESSLRDIREDTSDREIARYLDRDDMVTTALTTFVSMTVGCARCHDHKFDPISQKDYYALQAVFAGVDKAERPYDIDATVHRQRREFTERLARLRKLKGTTDPSLMTPQSQAAVAAWEKEAAATASRWVILDPVTFTSANGATLRKLPDLSLLSEGKQPETDTYTVTAHTDTKGITALRLELLTDDSLPHRGPGRQDNGNLHLNEFRILAAPRSNASAAKPVAIRSATADFNQDGWTIAMAIDGNAKSAWGIYPAVGKPHQGVFEFRDPVGSDGGTTFTCVLEQTHGGHHLIGRLRLSITTVRGAGLAADALPPEVAAVLAVPAAKRTDRQKADLALHVLEQDLQRQLAALPAPRLVYSAANDFKPDGSFRPSGKPRIVRILRRGELKNAGDEAAPGTLSCVRGLESRFRLADPMNEGSRRAALAEWVVHRDNPLTWRSIVNRVWQHHFGRGIVDTPNDLGKMGGRPSHPELLDWLAVELRDGDGSLKKLHRLIVTSATYRQSSRHNPRAAEIDADNRLLWRMNRTRLDAESVRDAVLQFSGKLDLTMYGPSVKQFIEKPGIHVTPLVDYTNFDVDRPENARRSVYRFLFRTLPDPFMETLDCADASQLTPVRNISMSALQALALWNNKFMVRQSEHLATRLAKPGTDLASQVREAYELVLHREPSAGELKDLMEYGSRRGLANACRVLLNSNEFLFVD